MPGFPFSYVLCCAAFAVIGLVGGCVVIRNYNIPYATGFFLMFLIGMFFAFFASYQAGYGHPVNQSDFFNINHLDEGGVFRTVGTVDSGDGEVFTVIEPASCTSECDRRVYLLSKAPPKCFVKSSSGEFMPVNRCLDQK